MIDGANKSQRMMGGRVKGHVQECCGSRSECNEVRQKTCIQKRCKRYRERGMETEGTVRGDESGKQEIARLIVLS